MKHNLAKKILLEIPHEELVENLSKFVPMHEIEKLIYLHSGDIELYESLPESFTEEYLINKAWDRITSLYNDGSTIQHINIVDTEWDPSIQGVKVTVSYDRSGYCKTQSMKKEDTLYEHAQNGYMFLATENFTDVIYIY